MSRENEKNEEEISRIESDLYAIIASILNLDRKYRNGQLKDSFFQKTIRNAINELIQLNFAIQEQQIVLSELLQNMNYTREYYKAIDIINQISSLGFISDNEIDNEDLYPQNIRSSILELPGLTSEITSSFITLLDALKINALNDKRIIINLCEDLKEKFSRFPGLDALKLQYENLRMKILEEPYRLIADKIYRDIIGQELYIIFNEFQKKLNLKI